MKRKKIIISSLCLCLFGCAEAQINVNEQSSVNMAEMNDVYIAQDVLNTDEQELLDLVKGKRNITIWDLHADESIQTMRLLIYAYQNDAWEEREITVMENIPSKMAVLLDDFKDDQEFVFTFNEKENSQLMISSKCFEEAYIENSSHGYEINNVLSLEQKVNQPIPLIMLFGSDESYISNPGFQAISEPERITERNLDYCYVISVEFLNHEV